MDLVYETHRIIYAISGLALYPSAPIRPPPDEPANTARRTARICSLATVAPPFHHANHRIQVALEIVHPAMESLVVHSVTYSTFAVTFQLTRTLPPNHISVILVFVRGQSWALTSTLN